MNFDVFGCLLLSFAWGGRVGWLLVKLAHLFGLSKIAVIELTELSFLFSPLVSNFRVFSVIFGAPPTSLIFPSSFLAASFRARGVGGSGVGLVILGVFGLETGVSPCFVMIFSGSSTVGRLGFASTIGGFGLEIWGSPQFKSAVSFLTPSFDTSSAASRLGLGLPMFLFKWMGVGGGISAVLTK